MTSTSAAPPPTSDEERMQSALAGHRCAQTKIFWANPACKHVYMDHQTINCTAYRETGDCECHSDPDILVEPGHFEARTGHVEYSSDGLERIYMCETCRADPAKRKVSDEESGKKEEKKKTWKKVEKDMEKIVKLR